MKREHVKHVFHVIALAGAMAALGILFRLVEVPDVLRLNVYLFAGGFISEAFWRREWGKTVLFCGTVSCCGSLAYMEWGPGAALVACFAAALPAMVGIELLYGEGS